MDKLYQIKRSLITDIMKIMLPTTVNAKKPLNWWLENKIAKKEDLEEV